METDGASEQSGLFDGPLPWGFLRLGPSCLWGLGVGLGTLCSPEALCPGRTQWSTGEEDGERRRQRGVEKPMRGTPVCEAPVCGTSCVRM